MAFADISSELTGVIPGLSGYLADSFTVRAWRKIRNQRLWSFLDQDDAIVCPPMISAGSFAFTQYQATATANSAASAALLALNPVLLPLQFIQIRFMTAGTTSQVYSIESVNKTNPAAIILTLDRAIVEPSSSVSPYMAYRCYVSEPVPNFLNWLSLDDMTNGIPIPGKNLTHTSAYFDAIDPQRQNLGQAFYLGFFKNSDDGVPLYELWPHPTQGQTFYSRFRTTGTDFVNPTDVQPSVIPDDLIMQCALAYFAYPWARTNIGHFPALAKTNWSLAIKDAREAYLEAYRDAKRQDDEIKLTSVINRGHWLRERYWPYPIDSTFIQTHLVPI